MSKQANKFDYLNWLKEVVPLEHTDCYIHYMKNGNKTDSDKFKKRFYFYTHDHKYAITVVWEEGKKGYMGCIASCRKPRAGEDWTRGNDLPDGPYCYETWEKIKNGIIKYELVKVAKKVRLISETEEDSE